MRIIPVFCICFFAVFSCGKKQKTAPVSKPVAGIIHPLYFQEEIYAQLNFPFWFNDSLVRQQQIRQIVRLTFASFEVNPDEPGNKETFPRVKTIYTFAPEGQLVMLEEIHFADGIEIARRVYSIDEARENGLFRAEEISTGASGTETDGFVIFKNRNVHANYWQLDTKNDLLSVHYFTDPKFWGTLSVDSIAHPDEKDWVVFGYPSKPIKRYQVKNTVSERNVTHYEYRNGNFPSVVTWNDYPFMQKRYYEYNRSGIFTGYEDSTFMDNTFVTRSVTQFELDELQRPVKIVHQKAINDKGSRFKTVEKISYITFTSE